MVDSEPRKMPPQYQVVGLFQHRSPSSKLLIHHPGFAKSKEGLGFAKTL